MDNEDNMVNTKNKFKMDLTHVILLIMILILMISNRNHHNEMKKLIRGIEINQSQPIDYQRIEIMMKKNQEEIGVDYDYIESLIKTNQAQVEKDFGEKFEEMTDYFGYKFKTFVKDVNHKLNE